MDIYEFQKMREEASVTKNMGLFGVSTGSTRTRHTRTQKEFEAPYKPKEKYEHPFLKPNNQD
jgi:hypothetical protein